MKSTPTLQVIDRHVGHRLALRRQMLRRSQSELGKALDVTFQQVQKYERGITRICASKLFMAATFLDAPVSYFFEGLSTSEIETAPSPPNDLGYPRDAASVELLRAFDKMSGKRRRSILALTKTMAGEDDLPG